MSDITEERFPDSAPGEDEDRTYGASEFADNPEPRCPVLIIADCSGSMAGPPMDAMNQGVDTLYQAIAEDEVARNRVEVALLSFSNEARVEHDFSTVSEHGNSAMVAGGVTNMHLAIQQGCDLLDDRKEQYRRNGIPYYQPIMVLFSDGLPSSPRSEMQRVNDRLVEMENHRRLTIFKVAVTAEAVRAMQRALPNPVSKFQPLQLDNLRFTDFFVWLSRSLSATSRSVPGDDVPLPPADWSTMRT